MPQEKHICIRFRNSPILMNLNSCPICILILFLFPVLFFVRLYSAQEFCIFYLYLLCLILISSKHLHILFYLDRVHFRDCKLLRLLNFLREILLIYRILSDLVIILRYLLF